MDPGEVGRLRWQCRRGLLENDLFIDRFFKRNADGLTQVQAQGLRQLMTLSDPDLLDLLLARKELEGEFATEEAGAVLRMMRTPPLRRGTDAPDASPDRFQDSAR